MRELPALYVISDRRLCSPPEVFEKIAKAAPRGSVLFQVREKDLSARALFTLVEEVVQRVKPFEAKVLVNDRLDVALAAGADGVHLSGRSVSAKEAKRLVSWVGASTHNEEELTRAEGATFCTFGPIYETPSKRAYGRPVGEEALSRAAQRETPLYALGGVALSCVPSVIQRGARGVAVISAVLAQPDPVSSALALIQAVEGARAK